MTDFRFEAALAWDRHGFFTAMRDRMEEYACLLPNVVSAEVLDRETLDGARMRIRRRWRGRARIPLLIRPIVKPHMIAWQDDVTWDEETYSTRWRVETFHLNEFFTCEGESRFEILAPEQTKVCFRARLHIYIPRLHPLPDRLVRGAGAIMERLILSHVRSNLTAAITALRSLAAEGRTPS